MENKENIYKKIFELKSHIGKISKDSTNPFHSSKYFDINKLLEVVEPLMAERNLLLLQPIQDNRVKTLIIDLDSKEQIFSEIELTPSGDPQKIGSQVTYFRRYALKSLLGIQEEDDDGHSAVKREAKKPIDKPVEREITTKEVLGWNGKIYKGDIIYINNVKIKPPADQIEKLKEQPNYVKD